MHYDKSRWEVNPCCVGGLSVMLRAADAHDCTRCCGQSRMMRMIRMMRARTVRQQLLERAVQGKLLKSNESFCGNRPSPGLCGLLSKFGNFLCIGANTDAATRNTSFMAPFMLLFVRQLSELAVGLFHVSFVFSQIGKCVQVLEQ